MNQATPSVSSYNLPANLRENLKTTENGKRYAEVVSYTGNNTLTLQLDGDIIVKPKEVVVTSDKRPTAGAKAFFDADGNITGFEPATSSSTTDGPKRAGSTLQLKKSLY